VLDWPFFEAKVAIPSMNSDLINQASVSRPNGWSNRVLLLALVGIFFLTFYPFRFASRAQSFSHSSPLLLGGVRKEGRSLDILLNILLFIPFGFGVSEKLRERAWPRGATFVAALIAGFALTYSVEFAQQYTPTRDSRWEDVLTNTIGSVAGFVMFELCGRLLVRWASRIDGVLRASLTLRRAALLLPVYFVLWSGVTAALQRETHLTNWVSDARLVVGKDAGGYPPSDWKGSMYRLQLWSRALPGDLSRAITNGSSASQSGLVASYYFLSSRPLQDRMQTLSDLQWNSRISAVPTQDGLTFGGDSWLSSQAPVTNLVETLQKTNQFSLEFACTPAASANVDADIVSISAPSGIDDLYVRQEDSGLTFWFRNPITIGHARLDWSISDSFAAGQRHDVLFSYDGSDAAFYVDGQEHRGTYQLGPGTVLAELMHRVKPAELRGYAFIYDALVFFPAGALLGLAAFPLGPRNPLTSLLLAGEFILAPWLLDRILSRGSGRPVSAEIIFSSLILVVAASLWINADRELVSTGD
jgi:glycopeptide antibiotics resistance protein